MDTMHRDLLLAQLNWRYATKQFEPHRKISGADWAGLEEALVLTPSSFACPMEGIEPEKYNGILGLNEQGLSAVVVAAAGYRAPGDNYAALKKVSFPKKEVLVEV